MCKWWHNWYFCVNYPFKQPVTSSWCYSPLFFSFYTVWRLRRVSGSFCYESSTGGFALMDDPLSWAETLSVSHKTLRRGAYNEPPLQQAKERKRGKNEKKDEINRQGLEERETLALVWLHPNSHTYTSHQKYSMLLWKESTSFWAAVMDWRVTTTLNMGSLIMRINTSQLLAFQSNNESRKDVLCFWITSDCF